MSWLFASGVQNIGDLASASVLLMNIQGIFPLGLTGLISLLSVQGTLKSLIQHHSSKASILWHSALFMIQFSHLYMTTGKTIALTIRTFVGRVMSLLFNTLYRFCHIFSSSGQGSCNFLAEVTIHSDFRAQENNLPRLHYSPIYLP